jgi:hypothetical protein
VYPPVTTTSARPCPSLIPCPYCCCTCHALHLSLTSTPVRPSKFAQIVQGFGLVSRGKAVRCWLFSLYG